MSTNQPHKWAEVIKAWADGKGIEFRIAGTSLIWQQYVTPGCSPNFDAELLEWRVVPERPRYRVALLSNGDTQWTQSCDHQEEAQDAEMSRFFDRWLTDWIEYGA